MDPDEGNLIGITIRNNTNSTLTNAKRYAPLCHRCNGMINNESYCFAINDSSIGCFVETVESSCYGGETNAAFKMQAGMLGTVIVVLITTVVTIACFAIYRHRRKKRRLAIVPSQEANEYLILQRDDDSAY
ncbi:multiple epidermal growth factor-like domains protein 11 isoform X1 [Apis mellifera carnica]|nr:multiple epidermal growth factor-like domains protein 11 isoform X1 [Apis mellifera carnica]